MSLYVSRSKAQTPASPGPGVRRVASRLVRVALTATVLGVVAVLLAIEAYTDAAFAPDARPPSGQTSGQVPTAVKDDGGPVIDATGDQPRTLRVPRNQIVLTFDDGPDPRWTPQILDVLARHHVPATFFVIGSEVARHPDLARREVAEGHEIGVHTFTHPDLGAIGGWRQRLEYAHTQLAIAYATGVKTSILRPPYSSTPDAVTDRDWPVLAATGRSGYLTVLDDTDSQDWARPGVDRIVANATPSGDGAIVLMHDAGGDRAQTVAALDRFIPQMQARGYQFATVSQALRDSLATPVNQPSSTNDRWRGAVVVHTVGLADLTLRLLWVLLLTVGVLTLARTLLMFTVAVRHSRSRRAAGFTWGVPVTEPVSVIVPAHDEQDTIAATVRTLVASDHPVEIVVVDDGSDDATSERVRELELDNVRLVRVPGGGKATALKAGVAMASHALIVMIDADTVVRPETIRRLIQPFADPAVGAVAGNVKVGNRASLIGRWQHLEYVIGFNLDRRLYDSLGCIPTVPGALGSFRRQALADAGGPPTDTLAEDTDLTMAVLRAGWRVVYEESAQAVTEAPATLRQLWRQRYRWSYGTMQAMWKHRHAVVERGASGRFGRVGLPLIALFSVILPVFGPLLDILAVYGVLFLDRWATLAGWIAVLIVQAITAVLAFRLDREPLRPLWALPLQQVAYRQIMYLVLVQSVVTALAGRRLGWQKIGRSGEVAQSVGG